MNWNKVSNIADILGIISFLFSLGSFIISGTILSSIKRQKSDYKKERKELHDSLCALRENIWRDGLTDIRIRDKLQTLLFGYRMRYWLLSSPLCHYHVHRCLKLLSDDRCELNSIYIRNHINYIIARLIKKE